MSVNKKIRVAVLYGGRSGEHEVSQQSATSVIKNLDPERFEIIPIGIDKEGHWLQGDMQRLEYSQDGKALLLPASHTEVLLPPHPQNSTQLKAEANPALGQKIDVVFPVLHGTMGEDGTVQGLFELADIAYVGCGLLGSAIGMDKDIAKRLVAAAGIPIAAYVAFTRGEWQHKAAALTEQINTKLHYPVFVKPANAGSSLGITKVKSADELITAVKNALLYDTKVLVEKAVNAREIELAVLENVSYGVDPQVSIAGEIIPHHEFYSYEAKYLDPDGAGLAIPAKLSAEQHSAAQSMAAAIFKALECEGMARVDLFLDKDTGEFIFNEVNTIPGFTTISMYPKLWKASGISYQDLLSTLINLAMARHERKRALKREWVPE
ncbi:MAG: D-alanine--D-alanine ligase family protein [Gammaproteobacteria bacterium]|nr:D-alanine--D-alanine ligase family protein [Gammaproteobacteria bacterium]